MLLCNWLFVESSGPRPFLLLLGNCLFVLSCCFTMQIYQIDPAVTVGHSHRCLCLRIVELLCLFSYSVGLSVPECLPGARGEH